MAEAMTAMEAKLAEFCLLEVPVVVEAREKMPPDLYGALLVSQLQQFERMGG